MINFRLMRAICLTGFVLGSSASVAEIISLPDGGLDVTQAASSPQRGESNIEILKRFGEPVQRYRAVGTPAISSWEYSSFRVYFENDTVIHAVHKGP